MVRASRAVESMCRARLAPFTGLVESHRAIMLDTAGASAGGGMLLNQQAQLAEDFASFVGGASSLVRYVRLDQQPPLYADMWVGSVSSVQVFLNPAGTQILDGASGPIDFFADIGLVRFQFGTYVPVGSMVRTIYGGGYQPAVPDDLVQATTLKAAVIAVNEITPGARPSIALDEINATIADLLEPFGYCPPGKRRSQH
jgi:hypothetical protein